MNWPNTQTAVLDAAAAISQFGINWLLQSTLLIATGLLIGRLLARRGSAAQSAVYRTTLAAVLICPIASLVLWLTGASGWSIALPQPWMYEEPETVVADAALPITQPPAAQIPVPVDATLTVPLAEASNVPDQHTMPAFPPASVPAMQSVAPAEAGIALSDSTPQTVEEPTTSTAGIRTLSVRAWGWVALGISTCWLLISAVLLGRLAMAWWRLSCLRRGAAAADAATGRICGELAERLGVVVPDVLRSPYLPSPCLAGLRRPAVLLPEAELSLSVRDVLIHELAHLARRDCHWNLLRQLAASLFFFQPLLWKVSSRLEATAEEVCDDYVVHYGGNRQQYAHRLVDIAELAAAPVAAAGLGIVGLRSMLARRVQRIMDTSRSLSTRVGNLLLVLVLVGGLLGTTIVGLVGIGPQRSVAEAAPAKDEDKGAGDDDLADTDAASADTRAVENDTDVITVRGRVLDSAGQPVPEATVRLVRYYWDRQIEHRPLNETKTDQAGRFEVTYRKSQFNVDVKRPRQWREVAVAAFKPGNGPDWVWMDTLPTGEQVELRLPADDVQITGRVIDLEGRPVAGVHVEIRELDAPKDKDLSAWLEAVKQGEPPWTAVKHLRDSGLPFEGTGLPESLITDDEGRFRLSGVGRERTIDLAFEGPSVARTSAIVTTRAMSPLAQTRTTSPRNKNKTPVLGRDFEITLPPTRAIAGVVRDAATGEALEDVSVQSWQFSGGTFIGQRQIRAVSDEQGRFRLIGMPKGEGNQIVAVPNDQQPYLMRVAEVPDEPGLGPVTVDLKLHKGVWITGRVTDQATGEPISTAHLYYLPFLSNEYAQALPEFGDSGNVEGTNAYQDRYRTGPDGTYRLVGLPGRAIVGVRSVEDTYRLGRGADEIEGRNDKGHFLTYRNPIQPSDKWPHALKEINPAKDADSVRLDFALDPGKQVEVTTVDPHGQPIADVSVTGRTPNGYQRPTSNPTFTAVAFGPDEERTMLFHHQKLRLGKLIHARANDAEKNVTVRLEPCATIKGQLVDENHVPVTGAEIRIDVHPMKDFGTSLPKVTTNAEGRFEHNGVLPGASYTVNANGSQFDFCTVAENVSIEPGETIDLGTVDVTSDERPELVRMKAVASAVDGTIGTTAASHKSVNEAAATEAGDAPAASREFKGKVVDPSGKPVAGAALYLVFYAAEPTGLLTPTSKPVATTGDDGEFRFTVSPADFGLRATAREFGYASLVAVKDGFGFAWSGVSRYETNGKSLANARARSQKSLAAFQQQLKTMLRGGAGEPLKLVPDDQPIRGRIVDINGQPVVGARLTLLEVLSGASDDLSGWHEEAEKPKADFYSARTKTTRSINGPQVRSLVGPAVTDEDGRFVLRGVGRGRIVRLLLEGPRIESARIFARTEAGEKIELVRERRSPDLGSYIYYPCELDYVAGPSAIITGVVRDGRTKAPLAGVTVKSQKRHGERINGWGQDFVRAVTDDQGRYKLPGMPIGSDNRIAAIAPDGDVPYLSMSKEAATSSPDRPIEVDFDLHTGVWIEGRIVDKQTGKGLAGRVAYYVKNDSPSYEAARTLRVDERDRLLSDDEGRFRIAALPGPGLIGFMANDHQNYPRADVIVKLDGSREKAEMRPLKTRPHMMYPGNYHIVAEVDPAADQRRVVFNLELDGGNSVFGRVVGSDGKPVTGFRYSGRMAQFGTWDQSANDKFELKGYNPDLPRHVYFAQGERNLAGSMIVEGKVADNLVVELQPAGKVKGRLVDQDGAPLPDVQLLPWSPRLPSPDHAARSYHRAPLPPNLENWSSGQYETDDQGRFEISCLAPGVEYRLRAYDAVRMLAGGVRMSKVNGPLDVVIKVAPGESKDLGDVRLADEAELSAAINRDQKQLSATPAKEQDAVAPPVNIPDGKPAADAARLEFSGTVVDPNGGPAAGARVYLLQDVPTVSEPILMARTKSDGTFSFTVEKKQFNTQESSEPWLTAKLVAVGEGRGLAWALAASFEGSGKLLEKVPLHPNYSDRRDEVAVDKTLRLVADDVPVEGRIIDIEGRPVAGARVRVIDIRRAAGDNLDAWLEVVQDETRAFDEAWNTLVSTGFNFRRQVEHFFPDVTTGADGRFRLGGIGRERIALLQLEGVGIETRQISARTRSGPTIHVADPRFPKEQARTYYGATFDEVVGPSRPVAGVVRDKDTGRPLAGARVEAYRLAGVGVQPYPNTLFYTTTDREGRYELHGLPVGENELLAQGPRSEPYLVSARPAEVNADSKTIVVDFDLKRGVWIRGRVSDAASGEPLRATVQYYAFRDNPHLREAPGYSDAFSMWFETDVDGRFEIAGLPGRGMVGVRAKNYSDYPIGVGAEGIEGRDKNADYVMFRTVPEFCMASNFHAVAAVNPGANGENGHCDFALVPGGSVSGTVLDPQGKPLPGALFVGAVERQVWQPLAGASFTVHNLEPGQSRRVQFYHAQRRLAGTLLVKGDEQGPLTVTLEPWAMVTGRVVDAQGEVVGAVRIYNSEDDPRLGILPKQYAYQTDGDGRFTIEGFAPGVPYVLGVTKASLYLGTLDTVIKLAPGESKDLGDVRLTHEENFSAAIERAQKQHAAMPAEQHAVVAGRVTLPDGARAADAYVAVIATRTQSARGGDLSPRGEVLAEGRTDENGAYQLSIEGTRSTSHRGAHVIARRDGYGIAWQPIDLDAASAVASLALAVEEPIRGRLVDIEGQAAGGVQLSIRSVVGVSEYEHGIPDWQNLSHIGYWGGTIPAAWLQPVTSDDAGRFTVNGIPAGHGVYLNVAASDRFAPQSIALNTGMPEQRGPDDGTYRSLVKNAEPGEEAVVALAPAQLFEGVVTYEDTGEPAGGARLTIWASQQEIGSMTSVAGQTDEHGKYRVSPHPGIRFGINAYPPDGTPYLARKTPHSDAIKWQDGDRVKQVDVKLPRGVLVRGAVVEQGTGKPVAGASIQYHEESAHNDNDADDILTGWQGIELSDEQGKFEIAVLPGPGRLLVHGPQGKYVLHETSARELSHGTPGGQRNYAHAIERIEPAPGSEPIELTIQLEPGATVTGKLVDEQEQPIDEAQVISRLFIRPHSPFWRGYGDLLPAAVGGEFELSGLGPHQQYNVHFLDAKRRLGATETVRADSNDLRVVLKPCGQARARFVDSEGNPHVSFSPGLHIVITPGAHEHDWAAAKMGQLAADADFVANVDRTNYWPGPKTNEQGHVTFSALIPGAVYRISTYEDGKPRVLKQFSVKPGETVDLGEMAIDLDG